MTAPHEADVDWILDNLAHGPVRTIVRHERAVIPGSTVESGAGPRWVEVDLEVHGTERQCLRFKCLLRERARLNNVVVGQAIPLVLKSGWTIPLKILGVDNFVRSREILNSLLDD